MASDDDVPLAFWESRGRGARVEEPSSASAASSSVSRQRAAQSQGNAGRNARLAANRASAGNGSQASAHQQASAAVREEEERKKNEIELEGCTAVPPAMIPGDADIKASLQQFLETSGAGTQALRHVLRSAVPQKPHGVRVSFLDLMDYDPVLAHVLLFQPDRVLSLFNACLMRAQWKVMTESRQTETQTRASGAPVPRRCLGAASWSVKQTVRVRVHTLPYFGGYFFHDRVPGQAYLKKLVEFQGTVVRVGKPKTVLERAKFQCAACLHAFEVEADFEQMNTFPRITQCPNPEKDCPARAGFTQVEDLVHVDYQEIKLQEHVAKMGSGTVPKSTVAILRHSLVDSVKAGDDCRLTAIPKRRWRVLPSRDEQLYEVELVLDTIDVLVVNKHKWSVDLSDESTAEFRQFWSEHVTAPLMGRNKIISSVCPQLFGMAAVKLALLLCVIGGVRKGGPGAGNSGHHTRGECHMLMVGEPGCGKSQCLKFAAALGARSVMTTGGGTTAAGLTVAAVREAGSGEFVLEAGALVLANDGICCIDEFSAIKKADRASIHEAMEQQSISVAKANIVASLPTRTTIIAATNPKGEYDLHQSLSVNVNLETPLLSRFDVVLVLADLRRHADLASEAAARDPFFTDFLGDDGDRSWDARVSKQVLATHMDDTYSAREDLWSLEKLRGYVAYVKKFKPRIGDAAHTILAAYYQRQRQADPVHQSRTTTRLLESLVRLAEAHAKLMRHEVVMIMDAVVAILICEISMSSVSLLMSPSEGVTPKESPMFGSDALRSAFSSRPETEYTILEALLLKRLRLEGLEDDCSSEEDIGAPRQAFPAASEMGYDSTLNGAQSSFRTMDESVPDWFFADSVSEAQWANRDTVAANPAQQADNQPSWANDELRGFFSEDSMDPVALENEDTVEPPAISDLLEEPTSGASAQATAGDRFGIPDGPRPPAYRATAASSSDPLFHAPSDDTSHTFENQHPHESSRRPARGRGRRVFLG